MRKHLRILPLFVGMMLTQWLGCGPCARTPHDEAHLRPRLLVVIVLDQFRYDYLVRFDGMFSGGLARFMREGALFTKAQHRHAVTECAPGHATLLTGCPPALHGIIGDAWYDRSQRKLVSALDDSACSPFTASSLSLGKSPRRMLRPALGDWIKTKNAASQVFSVAGSATAAILMAGSRADGAFWFDPASGQFTGSTYYTPSLPPWAKQWHANKSVERFRDASWEKLLPETSYFLSREDLFTSEADGVHTTFPHPLSETRISASSTFFENLAASPFGDVLTLDFAQTARRAYTLGEDQHVDLLCIGLSATHAIGNTYGPLSQEMQDHLLRLDLQLGEFIAALEREVGREHLLLALSSDHGVLPLPEELRRRGFEAARVHFEEARGEIMGALHEIAGAEAERIALIHNGLYLKDPAFVQAQNKIADQMRTLSFIADVFTAQELSSPAFPTREYEELFRQNYFAGRSPELMFRRKPYYLIWSEKAHGTAPGSAYDYDTHVPMIFWGNGIAAGRYETPCSTMDFAPTLAHVLGLAAPQNVLGKALLLQTRATLP